MPSDGGIIVTVNGFDDIATGLVSIFQKVKDAAIQGVITSSQYHLDRAISNVNNAYTSADYPRISYMYARWLAARSPKFKGSIPTDYTKKDDKALNLLADQIYRGKPSVGMVSGIEKPGISLLEGLHVKGIKDMGTTVSRKVVSEAKYSDDLERGYLFGKYRGVNKKRPFFTGHITATKTVMVDGFKDELKRLDK